MVLELHLKQSTAADELSKSSPYDSAYVQQPYRVAAAQCLVLSAFSAATTLGQKCSNTQ